MIKHVLKDGTVLNDITGHMVKKEDATSCYAIIKKLNDRRKK